MLDWIRIHKERLTLSELQDIRRYISLFRGRSDDASIILSDYKRTLALMEHQNNLVTIPPSLAAFLVKDADEYDPELWFLLPPHIGPSFRQVMALLVDEYGCAKICRQAGISRRTYYKLFDLAYIPSKDIVIRLAMAIGLSLGETHVLLNRAGHEFSKFSDRDLILDYCFQHFIYDIDAVNDALRRLGQRPLACK